MGRKLTEETKRKISLTRKKQEQEKKLALAHLKGTAPNPAGIAKPSKPGILIRRRDTAWAENALNLTPSKIRAILQGTQSGQLRDWADFCDGLIGMDAHLASLVITRKNAVAAHKLTVEPAIEQASDRAVADFIQAQLDRIPNMRGVVSHLLHGMFTGAAVAEIDWEVRWVAGDWQYWIKDIRPLHLRKFSYDDELKLRVDDSHSPGHGERLEDYPDNFIVHTPGVLSPYPNVDGYMRPAAWYSAFKRKGLTYWLAGAERFAFPAMLAVAPQNADETVLDNLRKDLENMTADAIAVVKQGVELRPLFSGAAGGDVVWLTLAKYLDAQMTKLITGGTLTVDAGSAGSYALGEVHERTRNDLSVGDAESLAETIKRSVVASLLRLNSHWLPSAASPTVYFEGVEQFDPLQPHHMASGLFTKNDIRRDVGYPPLPVGRGGDEGFSPDPELMKLAQQERNLIRLEGLIKSGELTPEIIQRLTGVAASPSEGEQSEE